MISLRRTTASIACACFCAACGGQKIANAPAPELAPAAASIESTVWAPELDIDLSKYVHTKSGAYYRDLVAGTGAIARVGDHLTMRYEVRLTNGQVVNGGPTSAPVEMALGSDIVREWVETVPGMRVGGIRRAIVPPGLAYGVHGNPDANIPPNAIVVLDIELLKIRP
jgi:FKBP-type peptidyl-prolyl cis-trans isomerase FkpA